MDSQKNVLKHEYSDGNLCCLSGYKVFLIPCTGFFRVVDLDEFTSNLRTPLSKRTRFQSKTFKRTRYPNLPTMPHRHPARHAECSNNKDHHNTVSTVPPTAPANAFTNKSSAAVQNTLYNVWCCRCGRLLNMQNVHYVHTCLCAHKRCDRCQMTPL